MISTTSFCCAPCVSPDDGFFPKEFWEKMQEYHILRRIRIGTTTENLVCGMIKVLRLFLSRSSTESEYDGLHCNYGSFAFGISFVKPMCH